MNGRILLCIAFLVAFVFVLLLSPRVLYASLQKQARKHEIVEQGLLKDVLKIKVVDQGLSEFPKGFEVEITNISSKPIYYINLMVEFPETKAIRGVNLGLPLRFGSLDLTSIKSLAKPNDPSIQPGETFVLKASDRQVEDYSKDFREMFTNNGKVMSQVRLSFQVIGFGDGTGYLIGNPYPQKRSSSSNLPFRMSDSENGHKWAAGLFSKIFSGTSSWLEQDEKTRNGFFTSSLTDRNRVNTKCAPLSTSFEFRTSSNASAQSQGCGNFNIVVWGNCNTPGGQCQVDRADPDSSAPYVRVCTIQINCYNSNCANDTARSCMASC